MKNKDCFSRQKGNFTQVPNKAFLIPDHYARTVFFTLLSYGETFNPTVKDLVRDSLISSRSVSKGIMKLIEYNMIVKVSSYSVGKHATLYEFVPHSNWNFGVDKPSP